MNGKARMIKMLSNRGLASPCIYCVLVKMNERVCVFVDRIRLLKVT